MKVVVKAGRSIDFGEFGLVAEKWKLCQQPSDRSCPYCHDTLYETWRKKYGFVFSLTWQELKKPLEVRMGSGKGDSRKDGLL